MPSMRKQHKNDVMITLDRKTGGLGMNLFLWAGVFLTACSMVASFLFASPTHAAVLSLSTGSSHACAVTNYKVSCWGGNGSGQVGNNTRNDATVPTPIYTKAAWTETVRECIGVNIFGSCIGGSWRDRVTNHTATALHGKAITKVSAGYNHTCALASARVYCWGNNDSGQLGNRSTESSNQPIAVDIASTVAAKPGFCRGSTNGITGCGFPTGTWVNEVPAVPASGLHKKEVIDVTAGYYFTCALASDGTVACWGQNDKGQLGSGDRTARSYPVNVNTATGIPAKPGYCNGRSNGLTGCGIPTGVWVNEVPAVPASALNGKKVKKLAKVKGVVNTMCAIMPDDKAVCWGENDLGQVGNGGAVSKSGKGTGSDRANQAHRCGNTKKTAYREALNSLPKSDRQDALRPAMVQTSLSIADITLTGKREDLANPAFMSGNNTTYIDATDYTYAVAHTVGANRAHYWGGSLTDKGSVDCRVNGQAYYGESTKSDATIERTYFSLTTPSAALFASDGAGPLKNQSLALLAGNAYVGSNWVEQGLCTTYTVPYWFTTQTKEVCNERPEGLVCATPNSNRSSSYCDNGAQTCTDNSNGSAIHIATLKAFGQYRQTCTINGPSAVPSGGTSWLQQGNSLTMLDVGFSGYACAVATNNTIGCWGKNDKGQLGVGDKRDKTVPTKVNL